MFSLLNNLVKFTIKNQQYSLIPSLNKSSSFLIHTSNKQNKKEPEFPPLNENELIEIYAKGTGPGGQKVNKATNRCQLKHIPTGITVSSHHTRSLEENRKLARRILQQKLDYHYNKENSYFVRSLKEKQAEKVEKSKRAVENLKRKKEFKEREGLE
jgi:protein subunit release factor B